MKKYVLGLIVLLALSGCSSSTEEPAKQKSNTASTVTTSTSSSSATSTSTIESITIENHDPITVSDPTNQKFITAFQEAGLGMYLETGYGVNDYTSDEKLYIILQDAPIVSGFNFLPEEFLGEFNNVMTIQNYASPEEMDAAANRINNQVDNGGLIANAYENKNTNSLFFYQKINDQELSKKYIEIFQNVK